MGWTGSAAAVIGALGVMSFAAPAHAIFVGSLRASSPITWTQDAAETGGTLFGTGEGQFVFSANAFASPLGDEVVFPVSYTLTGVATNSPATCCEGGSLVQRGLLIDFAIEYAGAGPLAIGSVIINPGDNLLSGTSISGAFVRMPSGGAVFPLKHDNPFLSDFADLSHQLNFAAGVSFGRASPVLTAQPGESVQSFTGFPWGVTFAASIPEPETWAMMIVGFWSIGAVLRQRRYRAVVA